MEARDKKVLVIGVIGADVHAVGNKILYHAFTEAGFEVVNLGVMVAQEEYIAAAPDVLDTVKRLGIQACGVANNHTMDYAIDGVLATMKHLDAAGIKRAVLAGICTRHPKRRQSIRTTVRLLILRRSALIEKTNLVVPVTRTMVFRRAQV